ncbi:unnamed protein product [Adineta steineri]|uniref:Uncharacterized protein n=1 Tax=Adineta steineri TaxID=433720 RepID=A0A814G1R6_9BILA|nr:unnamed protein product [Adineta steineri]
MALQLLPISMLYIVLQFIWVLMYAFYSAGVPKSVGASFYSDIRAFSTWPVLFTPFATVISLPDFGKKCQQLIFFWRPQRAVHPQAFTVNRQNINKTVLVAPKRTPTVGATAGDATAQGATTLATAQGATTLATAQGATTLATAQGATTLATAQGATTLATAQGATATTSATATKALPTMISVTTTLMTTPKIEMTPIDI